MVQEREAGCSGGSQRPLAAVGCLGARTGRESHAAGRLPGKEGRVAATWAEAGRAGLQVGLFWGRLPGGGPAPAFHLHLSLVSVALRELRILNTPRKAQPTKRKYVFARWARNWYDTWLQILYVIKSASVASGGEVGWGGAGGWVTRRLEETLR